MWWTMDKIKAANRDAGLYYFERDTMRFFRSRICADVYQGDGGVFFVTSEQFKGSDGHTARRKYTVRRFNPETSDVSTVGEFQQYHDIRTAKRAARREAATPKKGG